MTIVADYGLFGYFSASGRHGRLCMCTDIVAPTWASSSPRERPVDPACAMIYGVSGCRQGLAALCPLRTPLFLCARGGAYGGRYACHACCPAFSGGNRRHCVSVMAAARRPPPATPFSLLRGGARALATGRVGRHLYAASTFAFVPFFLIYFMPEPVAGGH